MFDNLSQKLNTSFKKLTGKATLSEANIKEITEELRNALLEADVAFDVITIFLKNLTQKALGKKVSESLNPTQEFIKLVQNELIDILGSNTQELNLNVNPPAIILVAGLQGAGKTTSLAKLAKRLKEVDKKKVLVTSVDIYRPAAMLQLQTLAKEIDVDSLILENEKNIKKILAKAKEKAKTNYYDVLLVDTAGRTHIDTNMMNEIKEVQEDLDPIETLFIADSMTGQDAANTAKAFNDALDLTGIILTKTDGDSRGGAALSIKHITKKPIKFLGTGEKTDKLEIFHPDRLAGRILNMGDMLSVIEEIEEKVDKKKAKKILDKVQKGKKFTILDLQEQLKQMQNMGSMGELMKKLPGNMNLPAALKNTMDDSAIKSMLAIISSMTHQEKIYPDILKSSRKKRIAKGSGTQVQDVNKLLKQYLQMQKMMKKLKGGGMQNLMRNFGSMGFGNKF